MDDDMNLNMTEITGNLTSTLFGTVYSKFNKPFIVSKPSLFDQSEIKNKYTTVINVNTTKPLSLHSSDEDNYICVDKYTNMVLESKQTLLVKFNSIYSLICSLL